MKALVLFCLLLVSLTVNAQKTLRPSPKALDEKAGFRDIKFGTPASQVPGLVAADNSGRFYNRPSDQMSIGDGKLKSITYYAFKGAIYAVAIEIEGQENAYPILQTLQSTYGGGYQSNSLIPEYSWAGTKVRMSYDENMISHDATIFTYDVALFAQKEADDSARAKQAKGDL